MNKLISMFAKSLTIATLCSAFAMGGGATAQAISAPNTPNAPLYVASAADEIQKGFNDAGGSSADDLPSKVKKIINIMLFIVGILAVIMIIYSGILYVIAHGSQDKIKTAKTSLIYSIVGLIVAILAYAIVNFVMAVFK